MADWRQIQARIRKAKNSTDPVVKLSELYQRTRDGMVAWEVGAVEEKNGRGEEAVKWYKVAAEKFRRADWKKKAEEALARLGVEKSEQADAAEDEAQFAVSAMKDVEGSAAHEEEIEAPRASQRISAAAANAADDEPEESEEEEDDAQPATTSGASGSASGKAEDAAKKKRRRGRRGGRGRRRKGATGATPGLPDQAFASSANSNAAGAAKTESAPPPVAASASDRVVREREAPAREPRQPRPEISHPAPQLPSERSAHGRSDPALSSRMAHLESLLRRLMSSPLHRLGEADEAPAGPGVFLLSESDQTSSYYIESCQTLRVGVGNLVRGARSQKGNRGRDFSETNLKERLADYLGINEAKVSQYLKDHCVVRWIQLDDDNHHLAHFAIGILRTPLNID